MEFEKTSCVAKLENLSLITGFVEECADHFNLESGRKYGLLIAVEEAFVNVCSYAYPNEDGGFEVSCAADQNGFVLELSDSGLPFDVMSLPDPDTTLDVMDRDVGGLGVYFIRKFSDEASYRRENDRNILRLLFKFSPECQR
jgi:anti-sigma regulatory factor (Ser/Thr protein kinase)